MPLRGEEIYLPAPSRSKCVNEGRSVGWISRYSRGDYGRSITGEATRDLTKLVLIWKPLHGTVQGKQERGRQLSLTS